MKLRIQDNSLRLRLSKSDLAELAEVGQLKNTIYFGDAPGIELTYGLAHSDSIHALTVEGAPQAITVLLPTNQVYSWVATDQVGISGEADLGRRGTLSVLIEKDFACLDRSDEDNADTFPNPHSGQTC